MLVKTTIFALAAFSLVSATRTVKCSSPKRAEPISQCNIQGGSQCCETVDQATDPAFAGLLSILGLVVEPVDALMGMGCIPIAGGVCNQKAVCCEHNNFNGLVNIGCSPMSL